MKFNKFIKVNDIKRFASIFLFTNILICTPLIYNTYGGNKTGSQDTLQRRLSSAYYQDYIRASEYIQRKYIKVPDLKEMTDASIDGMLRSLDPYSGYYTDEDLRDFLSDTEGEFGGIGVEIMYDSGAIKVITPIDDLPAYNAGITAGDYILGIDGELVSSLGFMKSVRKMRGKPDTKLTLLVLTRDQSRPKEIELTRAKVKIDPVKYNVENDPLGDIAYLRISVFNQNTAKNLMKYVNDIHNGSVKNNRELKGIILDLRNNPGGLLDQAVETAGYFIDEGTIVTVKGRNDEREIAVSKFVPKAPSIPMVVLINEGSASASEILAGALQDYRRAVIMGAISFGKGLVQTMEHISDRAAIKLTTQKYYTPSGKSINGTGIIPDIIIEPAKIEYADGAHENTVFSKDSVKSYLKKYNDQKSEDKKHDKSTNDSNGGSVESTGKDEKDIKDNKVDKDGNDKNEKHYKMSEKYKKDYQYAKAYDLIRGLIVMQGNAVGSR